MLLNVGNALASAPPGCGLLPTPLQSACYLCHANNTIRARRASRVLNVFERDSPVNTSRSSAASTISGAIASVFSCYIFQYFDRNQNCWFYSLRRTTLHACFRKNEKRSNNVDCSPLLRRLLKHARLYADFQGNG